MVGTLVLGAGFGGVSAALEAAARGEDVEVIDLKGYHEYTPGVIDLYRDRVPEKKLMWNLNDLFQGTGLDFSRENVHEIKHRQKRVKTNAGERKYRKLVLAMGSEPATYGMNISEMEHAYSLEAVKSSLDELEEAETAAVVGAGYVGAEVATELAERGIDVTVLEALTRPMPRCPESASRKVLDTFNSMEINFRGGKQVTAVEDGVLELDDGSRPEFDMVIWNAGIQARKVVQDSFGVGKEGVDVNSKMKARNFSDVYAVGDCADYEGMKTAHNAMRQGEVAGRNVAGGDRKWKEREYPLVTSLGKTGIVIYGDRSLKSRPVRSMKDMVRRYYWTSLRKTRWKARVL